MTDHTTPAAAVSAAGPATPTDTDQAEAPCQAAQLHIGHTPHTMGDTRLPVHCPGYTPAADEAPQPPADRAGLRDRIRRAICEAEGFMWNTELLEPDEYGEVADAVLAVLPEPADRDAVTPPPALTTEGRLRARVQVLEEDAERNQGLAKVGARCMRDGHQGLIESGRATIEGHRFALSVALDLDTGAPWDAIHERVKVLRRMADETATTQTEAHPAEHRWAAELYDPAADEWVPGTRYADRDRAVTHLNHANKIGPTWKDGTPTQRRLVRETTTYTVEPAAAQPAGGEQ